jgi:hypothetical protein
MALSKQFPTEPIDGTNPESIARCVKAQEVNCVPWSLWMTVLPSRGRRCSIAIPSALVTSDALGRLSIDQPTTILGRGDVGHASVAGPPRNALKPGSTHQSLYGFLADANSVP